MSISSQDEERAITWFDYYFPEFAGLLAALLLGKLADSAWFYDPTKHRYQNRDTGKWLSDKQVRSLAQAYAEARQQETDALADSLLAGSISLTAWVKEMRRQIKETYITEYLLGVGGTDQFDNVGWGDTGALLSQQYGFLNEFGRDIAAGLLSLAMTKFRSSLYLNSSVKMFERGRTRTRGMGDLPAYPGDGTSECGVNCKCWWRIVDRGDSWDCYWMRTARESCPTCISRASTWAPFTIYRRL